MTLPTQSDGTAADPTLTVQAPASTSNCGSGFDTLSLALTLYNFIRVGLRPSGVVESLGDTPLPSHAIEMASELIEAYRQYAGLDRVPGLAFEVWGDVPMARGLGSSSTVRGGLLAGLNQLCGTPLQTHDLIQIATRLEHAPDNSAAVFQGGFCVSRTDPESGEYLDSLRFPISEKIGFVVVSPDLQVLTRSSRDVLPQSLGFREAARTVNSVAYLTAAMISGNFDRLVHAVEDYLHEPYRQGLCAYVRETIAAGVEAGAYTGWISGSGSSVLCVVPEGKSIEVGKAISDIYGDAQISCQLFTLHADNSGLQII